jgi:hypothetical protein
MVEGQDSTWVEDKEQVASRAIEKSKVRDDPRCAGEEGMKYDWPVGPTYWQIEAELMISIPFTWNLPEVRKHLLQLDFFQPHCCVVGGPAMKLMPDYFYDLEYVSMETDFPGMLQRINPWATRTTTGCVNSCKFCAVPQIEGDFVELEYWPDLPVLCDNNLLASSQRHFDKVCDRLEKHSWCDFNQGLDCRLLTDYHAERIGRLKGAIVRLALDNAKTMNQWEGAFDLLVDHGTPKSRIRSYVICGFDSGITDAWLRCEFVEQHGAMALPQWYHPLDAMEYNAVSLHHQQFGWTKCERDKIMQYYYQHRGVKP